jgi:hypothetical protein
MIGARNRVMELPRSVQVLITWSLLAKALYAGVRYVLGTARAEGMRPKTSRLDIASSLSLSR